MYILQDRAIRLPTNTKGKSTVHLRLLLQSFLVIAVMAQAREIQYNEICAIFKSDIYGRKGKCGTDFDFDFLRSTARMPKTCTNSGINHEDLECWYYKNRGQIHKE